MNSTTETESEEEGDQTDRLIRKVMEARNERLLFVRYKFFYITSTVLALLLFILMMTWIYTYRGGLGFKDPGIEFNWHPLLMMSGLLILYGHSALLYRTARTVRKRKAKLLHAGMHGLAGIFAILGLKAAFDSHNYANPPKPNLYTLHSWIGVLTEVIFFGQFVVGFLMFLYPTFPAVIKQAYLHVHTGFGTSCFIMVVITVLMGLSEKAIWGVPNYGTFPGEGILINMIGVLVVFFGITVVYLLNQPMFKRVPLPEDEEMVMTDEGE